GRGGPGLRWGVLCTLFAAGALLLQVAGGGSGGSGGEVVLACAGACVARCSQRGPCSYGVGEEGRAGRGVVREPRPPGRTAGRGSFRSGVAVVAGVRERWSWLALGRALHAVRSGGAAPTGWGRRVERGGDYCGSPGPRGEWRAPARPGVRITPDRCCPWRWY